MEAVAGWTCWVVRPVNTHLPAVREWKRKAVSLSPQFKREMETEARGASALTRAELRLAPALRLCHPNTAGSCLASITVSGFPQEAYIQQSGEKSTADRDAISVSHGSPV